MSIRLSIRPAALGDLESLLQLYRECQQRNEPVPGHRVAGFPDSEARDLRERILDHCVLAGWVGGRVVAMNVLDLDEAIMVDTLVTPRWRRQGLGRRMVVALERLAVRFGMTRLMTASGPNAHQFLAACGYRAIGAAGAEVNDGPGCDAPIMWRDFPRRQTRYGARIRRLLDGIGVARDYGRNHRLMLQEECRELATIGEDIHAREQMLAPIAARAWYAMRRAAEDDGIPLQVASAYRSVGYQVSIIERKKQAGQDLDQILRVSAAPGYSEHHTGRALDLSTPGSKPLETGFENTEAFEWLVDSAHHFGFRMSFPRNNRHGIAYEPWHWCFKNE